MEYIFQAIGALQVLKKLSGYFDALYFFCPLKQNALHLVLYLLMTNSPVFVNIIFFWSNTQVYIQF